MKKRIEQKIQDVLQKFASNNVWFVQALNLAVKLSRYQLIVFLLYTIKEAFEFREHNPSPIAWLFFGIYVVLFEFCMEDELRKKTYKVWSKFR